MSSEKLRRAVETVKDWLDTDKIVGAVMLIIRHGKVILHEAIGWSDKEKDHPMQVGTIVRMRSMTKPLIGTAVLMLMEEGRLQLQDKVSQYLPSFDNPKSRDITIFQLLTHTSGITGSIYNNLEGTKYASLREAVDDVGRMGPSFKPGTEYHYSDPGSSTLGALVAEISAVPAEEFIQKRILDPLEMKDSFCNLGLDDPRKSRVGATYRRDSSKWKKYWDHSQPQLLPFFRASGGLYSTAMDYARFMTMMLQRGRVGTKQLLSPLTVQLATRAHSTYVYDAARLRERFSFYGLHWSVVTDKYRSIPGLVSAGSFGHGGSDGTLAWADPQQDLILIYLTQSRGDQTRWRFRNLVYAAIME
ncbi:beta-lactamase family protein [Acidobacteria bacterium AH-259-O06]|nr:beta-lactamase family protein [Acidobacteria bacterium AH-259-O06]